MSKSLKAILLSALVFPGTGHLFLKKYIRGTLLVLISLVCIYTLLSKSMEIAQDISTKIQTGEIPLEVSQLQDTLTDDLVAHGSAINISLYLLEICWVVGVIDSFRIGKALDKEGSIK